MALALERGQLRGVVLILRRLLTQCCLIGRLLRSKMYYTNDGAVL